MDKKKKEYLLLLLSGLILGIAMQLFPHFKGQWGKNIITYMATDLGSWAVISILIATYSKTPLQSGLKCFVFMISMVVGYYMINPISIYRNVRWFVLAFLMFPIGVFTYFYKTKLWSLIPLEVGMIFFLGLQIYTFINKITSNQMIVYDNVGDSVFINETFFSLGNYLLLIAASIFAMVFMILQYRKKQN